MVKSRQVDAYTIGHYHPHGECYGTIVQLVRQGFLDGQGNFGTNVGVEPVGAAAPRYTECKIGEKTVNLAFKYIKYSQWIDTELGDTEPSFLPAMFPLCLMGTEYTQGIGFGYKTYIPCYTQEDLHQRLLWLLGVRKRKPIIAPTTDCIITSPPEVLDELLTTGKAKVDIEGIIDVNPRNNTVVLKSWPSGKRFESFLNKFQKELSENMIGFSDLSVTETEIVFQVMRERNRDKIFKEFVEKLKESLKGSISFEIVTIDVNQKVVVKSVDEMLLNTYTMFTAVNDEMLRDEIVKTQGEIELLNTINMIVPSLSKCIKNGYDIEKSLELIRKETGINKNLISEIIDKYKIKKLLTFNTDNRELKLKKQQLESQKKNLTEFVLEQYRSL